MFEILDILRILARYIDYMFTRNDPATPLRALADSIGEPSGAHGKQATGLIAHLEEIEDLIDAAERRLDGQWAGQARSAFEEWRSASGLDRKSMDQFVGYLGAGREVLEQCVDVTLQTKLACEHLLQNLTVAVLECLAASWFMGWVSEVLAEEWIIQLLTGGIEELNAIERMFADFLVSVARLFWNLNTLLDRVAGFLRVGKAMELVSNGRIALDTSVFASIYAHNQVYAVKKDPFSLSVEGLAELTGSSLPNGIRRSCRARFSASS